MTICILLLIIAILCYMCFGIVTFGFTRRHTFRFENDQRVYEW